MNHLLDNDTLYSLTELAQLLHVSRATLGRAIQKRKLKAIRIERQWRVFGRDAIEYLDLETQNALE